MLCPWVGFAMMESPQRHRGRRDKGLFSLPGQPCPLPVASISLAGASCGRCRLLFFPLNFPQRFCWGVLERGQHKLTNPDPAFACRFGNTLTVARYRPLVGACERDQMMALVVHGEDSPFPRIDAKPPWNKMRSDAPGETRLLR